MGVELQLKTNIDSSDKLVDITWEIRPRRDGSGALRFNAGWQQQVAAGRLLEAIRGSSWPASRAAGPVGRRAGTSWHSLPRGWSSRALESVPARDYPV